LNWVIHLKKVIRRRNYFLKYSSWLRNFIFQGWNFCGENYSTRHEHSEKGLIQMSIQNIKIDKGLHKNLFPFSWFLVRKRFTFRFAPISQLDSKKIWRMASPAHATIQIQIEPQNIFIFTNPKFKLQFFFACSLQWNCTNKKWDKVIC